MELDPFAVRVCNVARVARRVWPPDRLGLMEDAGVFDEANKLDFGNIRAVIEADPSLIADWQAWSDDKRYGGPWLGSKDPDMVSACAQFIVRELGMFKEIRQRKKAK